MISLVIDCRMINKSGIGTYLKNILPIIIASKKFDIQCLGFSDLYDFTWSEFVRIRILTTMPLSPMEHMELGFKIPRCDIYWTPHFNLPLLPIRAKKVITTIHDVYPLTNLTEYSPLKCRYIKFLFKNAVRRSDKIITVSEFSKKEIVKYLAIDQIQIEVISLAVEDKFNVGFDFRNIPERYILYVGNVKPHKNLEKALIAFSELDHTDLKFFIVGKKEGFFSKSYNLSPFIKSIRERVYFTGSVSDNELKNFYANAALFLYPSKYEGFGLPVLEAMKFYLPIIASNAASIPEVGGSCLSYFDPNNLKELVYKLQEFIDGKIIVNKRLYDQQIAKFNWYKTALLHVDLFENVLYVK